MAMYQRTWTPTKWQIGGRLHLRTDGLNGTLRPTEYMQKRQ